MSFVLGITGGIATGKSTVVQVFREHGFPVVDGDLIARQIVEPGAAALTAIAAAFGTDVLLDDGRLDRKKLGQLIFEDEQKRQQLNQLLEPFLRTEINRQIQLAKQAATLVIADIPLLYEAHYEQEMDQVAVVYLPEDLQLKRLMLRDQLTAEQAKQRIASQLSIEEKKRRADLVFDNQGSREDTRAQIEAWLKEQGFS